ALTQMLSSLSSSAKQVVSAATAALLIAYAATPGPGTSAGFADTFTMRPPGGGASGAPLDRMRRTASREQRNALIAFIESIRRATVGDVSSSAPPAKPPAMWIEA